jgi:hypothetical protein
MLVTPNLLTVAVKGKQHNPDRTFGAVNYLRAQCVFASALRMCNRFGLRFVRNCAHCKLVTCVLHVVHLRYPLCWCACIIVRSEGLCAPRIRLYILLLLTAKPRVCGVVGAR